MSKRRKIGLTIIIVIAFIAFCVAINQSLHKEPESIGKVIYLTEYVNE